MESSNRWLRAPRIWLEVFVLANLTFLALDIYLAHSVNSFAQRMEWVPLYFSAAAPVFLLAGLIADARKVRSGAWRLCGFLVGWCAVAVGITGLILHLESHFFRERTLESLVYTAPFAAPLAYTGLGLLLIMNRMVAETSPEWPLWVLFLALGGFIGNFIFSLADHAQNGFFHWTEWIPVVASALAIGFLMLPFLVRVDSSFVRVCAGVMLIEAMVGIAGFVFHNLANLDGPSPKMINNFIYGAPALAPMLFPNLALLVGIGLGALRVAHFDSTGDGGFVERFACGRRS